MLKFSKANAKTERLRDIVVLSHYLEGRKVYSLDLLSGWSCPGAKDCLAKVHKVNGKSKLIDGPDAVFRCFSASQEVLYPAVYNSRKHNFDLIKSTKSCSACLDILSKSIPKNAGIVRYHVGGDFFKLPYLQAAIKLAELRPDVLFYSYTKSLHLVKKLDCLNLSKGLIRPNFIITASRGGKFDNLIRPLRIRTAKVIMDQKEAGRLAIDHDDSHAATAMSNFALLLHGVQKKGSNASKKLIALKGVGSYGKRRKTIWK